MLFAFFITLFIQHVLCDFEIYTTNPSGWTGNLYVYVYSGGSTVPGTPVFPGAPMIVDSPGWYRSPYITTTAGTIGIVFSTGSSTQQTSGTLNAITCSYSGTPAFQSCFITGCTTNAGCGSTVTTDTRGLTASPTYVGCFQPSSIDFTYTVGAYSSASSTQYTPLTCARFAQANSYAYAAISNGGTCMLGNSVGTMGTSTSCSLTCSTRDYVSSASAACGGATAQSVYYVNSASCAYPKLLSNHIELRSGSSAYLTIADSAVALSAASFSVCAWARRDATGALHPILSRGSALGTKDAFLQFGFNAADNFFLGFYGDDLVSSSTFTTTGTWMFWCGTFSTSSSTQTIYNNGAQLATRTASGQLAVSNQAPIHIGSILTNYFFVGGIDEVRLYSRELLLSEISSSYSSDQTGSVGYPIDALVMYLPFAALYSSSGSTPDVSPTSDTAFFTVGTSAVTNVVFLSRANARCVYPNACVTNNGGCFTGVTCQSNMGVATCGNCPTGYSGNGVNCTAVNPCNSNNGGCINSVCVYGGPGLASCGGCYNGYFVSGSVCTSQCTVMNGHCDPLSQCSINAQGVTCGACPSGYSGTGSTVCTDINECLSPVCPFSSTCLNLPGTYACIPFITSPVTLSDGGVSSYKQMSTGRFLLSNVRGGQVFTLSVNNVLFSQALSPALTTIFYYNPSVPQKLLTCMNSINFAPLLSRSSNFTVTCTIKPGIGRGLVFGLSSCAANFTSLCANTTDLFDSFDWPPPIFTSSSLSTQSSLFMASAAVVEQTTLADVLHFNGVNMFVNDASLMSVHIGNVSMLQCAIEPAVSNDTSVYCSTLGGGSGQLLNVYAYVTLGNYTVASSDTISYPAVVPVITSVSGCDVGPAGTTVNCNTAGGTTIVILGSGYTTKTGTPSAGGLALFVGGNNAVITSYSFSMITAILPAGIGLLQSVVVSYNSQFSAPRGWLSYAAPTITALQGCLTSGNLTQSSSSSVSVSGCKRAGSDVITIIGSNFGSAPASVFIGSQPCTGVTGDPQLSPVSLNVRLFCTTPSGAGANVPVLLLQANGQISTNFATLSYAQCTKGSSPSPLFPTTCVPCLAGSYTAQDGQVSCVPCAVGQYTSLPGQTVCNLCPLGSAGNNTGLSTCTSCNAGSFSGALGAIVCTQCRPGTYNNMTGLTTCSLCPGGSYSGSSGSTSCTAVLAGSFAYPPGSNAPQSCVAGTASTATGATTCFQCDPGYFAPTINSPVCLPCANGTSNSAHGSSNCQPCQPGSYAPNSASKMCSSCPAGSFASSSYATSCQLCPAGFFSSGASPNCLACPNGQFSNSSGLSSCSPCPAGSYGVENAVNGTTACSLCAPGTSSMAAGQSACASCQLNTYAHDYGMTNCPTCPGLTTSPMGATSCLCTTGYYSTDLNTCRPCEYGAICNTSGLTLFTLTAQTGFWQPRSGGTFYLCIYPALCPGGPASSNTSTACVSNRAGPLCAVCVPGTTSASASSSCDSCPSAATATAVTVVVSLVVLFALGVLYYIVIRADSMRETGELYDVDVLLEIKIEQEAEAGRTWQWVAVVLATLFCCASRSGRSFCNLAFGRMLSATSYPVLSVADRLPPSITHPIKILIGFAQIVTNVAVPQIPWPSAYKAFVSYFSFINIDFIPWQSMGCVVTLDYYTRLVVATLTPIGIFVLLLLFYVLPSFIIDRRDLSDDARYREKRLLLRSRFVKLTLFTLFLMYPFISAQVLSMYQSETVEGQAYLVADFTVKFGDSRWYTYLPYAVVMTLIYPIGIPVLFFCLLYTAQSRLDTTATQDLMGFLYDGYERDIFYFEVVDMCHKLALCSLLRFFPANVQLSMGCAIAVLYLMIVLVVSPFVRSGDDSLARVCQIELFLLLLAGYVLQSSATTLSSTSTTLDSNTDAALSTMFVLLLIVAVVVFVFRCFVIVRNFVRARQREQQRLKAIAAASKQAKDGTSIISGREGYVRASSQQNMSTNSDSNNMHKLHSGSPSSSYRDVRASKMIGAMKSKEESMEVAIAFRNHEQDHQREQQMSMSKQQPSGSGFAVELINLRGGESVSSLASPSAAPFASASSSSSSSSASSSSARSEGPWIVNPIDGVKLGDVDAGAGADHLDVDSEGRALSPSSISHRDHGDHESEDAERKENQRKPKKNSTLKAISLRLSSNGQGRQSKTNSQPLE